jgi:hypothetical protein
MAATITTVSPELIWTPERISRLWFFPEASEWLRYAPHFHVIYPSGFRTNLPLTHSFIVVLEGKLSIKNYYGQTTQKIVVRDQVWYYPGVWNRAQGEYAKMLPGKEAYARSGR